MSRPDELIRALGLQPHPEGGAFSEVFRSSARVQPADARGPRAALTTIYFLLTCGQRSRLHRVASDEVWHFYEGAPLELTVIDSDFAVTERVTLGALDLRATQDGRRLPGGTEVVYAVRAGMWQAARPLGEYSLVGCSVAPGFDFADFSMLTVQTRPVPIATIRELRSAWLRPFDRPETLVYRGDDDPHALHAGAFQDNALIGIASVAPGPRPDTDERDVWQLRGVAVHPSARGEGVGRIIMTRCMEHVQTHRGAVLWCNARVTAQDFYRQLGFERIGDLFEVPGTGPHYVMQRKM